MKLKKTLAFFFFLIYSTSYSCLYKFKLSFYTEVSYIGSLYLKFCAFTLVTLVSNEFLSILIKTWNTNHLINLSSIHESFSLLYV